jgi:RNA polymerase sigma-70 factor, ECF subfamily
LPPIPKKLVYDQKHFADLFNAYKNMVYKTAYLMLGDSNEAEEALQEVFVLVYRSLADYDPKKGAFSTWLHRITINYCLGRHRKHPLACQSLEHLDEQDLILADNAMKMEGLSLDEKNGVVQAIATLSERLNCVVILRYYWELPYAEIAQVLDIPLGTVKSRIDLALRTLRKELIRQEKIEEEVTL